MLTLSFKLKTKSFSFVQKYVMKHNLKKSAIFFEKKLDNISL